MSEQMFANEPLTKFGNKTTFGGSQLTQYKATIPGNFYWGKLLLQLKKIAGNL